MWSLLLRAVVVCAVVGVGVVVVSLGPVGPAQHAAELNRIRANMIALERAARQAVHAGRPLKRDEVKKLASAMQWPTTPARYVLVIAGERSWSVLCRPAHDMGTVSDYRRLVSFDLHEQDERWPMFHLMGQELMAMESEVVAEEGGSCIAEIALGLPDFDAAAMAEAFYASPPLADEETVLSGLALLLPGQIRFR